MQLNVKNYQTSKTKDYLRKNNFLLFSISANQNSQNWLTIEQGLNKLKLGYYKVYNNNTRKILKNSIFTNLTPLINSTFFVLKPNEKSKTLTKYNLISILNSLSFTILAIKLNKKIYSLPQAKNISSLDYKKNISVMYQFLLTNLKTTHQIAKKN